MTPPGTTPGLLVLMIFGLSLGPWIAAGLLWCVGVF